MNENQMRETLRQMLADWNNATDAQREEMLRQSGAAAAAAMGR